MRRSDEAFADKVAVGHIALMCAGPCLTLLQQWRAREFCSSVGFVEVETESSESFHVLRSWPDLTHALLDLFMPSNAVSELPIAFGNPQQHPIENATRYRKLFA